MTLWTQFKVGPITLEHRLAMAPMTRSRALPDGTPAPLQAHVAVFSSRPDPAAPGGVLPAELATVEDPARDVTLAGQGRSDG
jgi:2,4-dienoyl-CoA reductase-like NADH-dependent reductase (Old Yellow Enzyme family)